MDLLLSREPGHSDRIDWEAVATRIRTHPHEARVRDESFPASYPLDLALRPDYYGDHAPPMDLIKSLVEAYPPQANMIPGEDRYCYFNGQCALFVASENSDISADIVKILATMYPSCAELRCWIDEDLLPVQVASNAEKARILLETYPKGTEHPDGICAPVQTFRVDVVREFLKVDPACASRCRALELALSLLDDGLYYDDRDDQNMACYEICLMLRDVYPSDIDWPTCLDWSPSGVSKALTEPLDRLLLAPYPECGNYRYIDWNDVVIRLLSHPEEAAEVEGTMYWSGKPGWKYHKYYPLHQAISTRHDHTIHFPVVAARAFVDAFPFAATAKARDCGHYGQTALHVACGYDSVPDNSVQVILEADPTAAAVFDDDGNKPLHLALGCGRTYRDGVVRSVVVADPSALETRGTFLRMYPFQIAAVGEGSCLDTVYNLLLRAPHVLEKCVRVPTNGKSFVSR